MTIRMIGLRKACAGILVLGIWNAGLSDVPAQEMSGPGRSTERPPVERQAPLAVPGVPELRLRTARGLLIPAGELRARFVLEGEHLAIEGAADPTDAAWVTRGRTPQAPAPVPASARSKGRKLATWAILSALGAVTLGFAIHSALQPDPQLEPGTPVRVLP